MLYKFLRENETSILKLSEEKSKILAGIRVNSDQLKQGLPAFYHQLIKILEKNLIGIPDKDLVLSAAKHGEEHLKLGYSLSHVVHGYGAMCQAITEYATLKDERITAQEFNILNACLDVAIASAVSEFQFQSNAVSEAREIKHLGFLAHELRNALSSATLAHEMIKAGLVGTGGSTANVLEMNLVRMRNLIDRSLSEVRMRADSDAFIETFKLSHLVDQIIVTASIDAGKKDQTLIDESDWTLEISADRQYILSAIANLVQNAIKYSKRKGNIYVRTKAKGRNVVIEIEDACGGIDESKVGTIFTPFFQAGEDRVGLGLGLAITQRAVYLNQGTVSLINKPNEGCIFVIEIPQKFDPTPSAKNTVPGVDSIHPKFGSNKKKL